MPYFNKFVNHSTCFSHFASIDNFNKRGAPLLFKAVPLFQPGLPHSLHHALVHVLFFDSHAVHDCAQSIPVLRVRTPG